MTMHMITREDDEGHAAESYHCSHHRETFTLLYVVVVVEAVAGVGVGVGVGVGGE